MTSPALVCPTCRAAFDMDAASRSLAPLRDCCFEALRTAQTLAMVGLVAQQFVRSRVAFREAFESTANAAAVSKSPEMRAAALAWRQHRGANKVLATVVHAPNVGSANWLCGAERDWQSSVPQPAGVVNCPYCVGAATVKS